MLFKRKLKRLVQQEHTFFMIVMSGGLHVAKIAIEKFPSGFNLVVIGNAFVGDEVEWMAQNLPEYEFINIGARQYHHNILDILFSVWDRNFGIVDYDCFILDSQLISDCVKLGENDSVNAPYKAHKNPKCLFELPDTFLMYFNVLVLKGLIKKYGIGSQLYKWRALPPKVKIRLGSMGLSEDLLPDYKSYLDTTRALLVLGMSCGYQPRFISNYNNNEPRSVHVGDIAKPNTHREIYGIRGSFFWRAALRVSNDPVLVSIAKSKFDNVEMEVFLSQFPDLKDRLGSEFMQFCCKVLSDDILP